MRTVEQLVRGSIVGVHAGQALAGVFSRGKHSEAQLKQLNRLFNRAAMGDDDAAAALVADGLKVPANAPVSIMAKLLAKAAPQTREADRLAVANLWQLALEEARDGGVLQELFALYVKRGLATYFGALGLDYGEKELIALGRAYAQAGGEYPFKTGNYETGGEGSMSPAYAAALSLTKIKLWGERHSGTITAGSMAAELEQGALLKYVPQMKKLSPMRLCNLGHSFASPVHWSSHGTFACIHAASLQRHNPGIQVKHVNRGGMTYSRALRDCMGEVLEFRPDFTIIVLACRTEEDFQALETICSKLEGRALFFEALTCDFHKLDWSRPEVKRLEAIAAKTGATLVRTRRFLDTHPERKAFICMDKIHMYPSYHRAMTPVLTQSFLERMAKDS